MSLPFLLEIGTEEIPDWMIPEPRWRISGCCSRSSRFRTNRSPWTPRRAAWCCAPTGCRRARPTAKSASWDRPNRRPRRPWPGSRASRAIAPEDLAVETTPKGEYYSFTRKVAGRHDQGHSGRSAARHHSADLLPQDHVLDRQGRPALHPADSLDRGAAGRRDRAVRTGRRSLGQP